MFQEHMRVGAQHVPFELITGRDSIDVEEVCPRYRFSPTKGGADLQELLLLGHRREESIHSDKDTVNSEKHGISFTDAQQAFFDPYRRTGKRRYYEERDYG